MKLLIDTNWLVFIQDLSQEKQNEIMLAILDYPNRECSLNCWVKIIKPELEKGKIAYFNKLKNLKQNSIDSDIDSDTDSDIDSDTVSSPTTPCFGKKEKEINKDKIDRDKGVQGEKRKKGSRFENSEYFQEYAPEEFITESEKLNFTENTFDEYQRFKDYWISSSGKNAVKLDWLATWRNWLRNNKGNSFKRNSEKTLMEKVADVWDF